MRVTQVFKQTPDMLAAIVQPSANLTSNIVAESSTAFSSFSTLTQTTENIQNDPFLANAPAMGPKPEPGIFTNFSGGIGKGIGGGGGGIDLDTPTAHRDQDNLPGLERQIKPPGAPLRKTRATTVDATSRRGLASRNAKDANNEGPKRTTSHMAAESGNTATRRSTRLLNTKLTTKFLTGGSIAERSGVNAKERETKKSRVYGSRSKTANVAAAAEKILKSRAAQNDANSTDIAVSIPVAISLFSHTNSNQTIDD